MMQRTSLVLSTLLLGMGVQLPVHAVSPIHDPETACIVSRDTGAKYCLEAGQRSGYSLPSYIYGHDVDVIAPDGLAVQLSDLDNLSYNHVATFSRHTHNKALRRVRARNGHYLDFSNPRSMRVISTNAPHKACVISRLNGAEFCLKPEYRNRKWYLPFYMWGHPVDVLAPEGLAVQLKNKWSHHRSWATVTTDTNNEDLTRVRTHHGYANVSRPFWMRVINSSTIQKDKQLIQDFNGFAHLFSRGSWGLFTFKKNYQPVTESDKTTFVDGKKILFQVKWTERTLRAFLGDESFVELKTSIGVDKIRNLVGAHCPAKLEIGHHRTYGNQFGHGYTSELDTDTYHCYRGASIYANHRSYPLDFSTNASTVTIESYLPTVPGATYTLDLDYQKRNHNSNVHPDEAFRELLVKVASDIQDASVQGLTEIETDSHTVYLPIDEPIRAQDLHNGFAKAKITFKADRFFTKISLQDMGNADSMGILVTKVVSDETKANPFEVACKMFHPHNPELQKACLTSTGEPTYVPESCDLNIDNHLGNFVVDKAGERVSSRPERYVPENIFSTDKYYSVGKSGISTLKLAENGVYSGCSIRNRKLSLEEFTNNNQNFKQYAEQGLIKVLLSCKQDHETVKNWETLETTYPENLLVTNRKINQVFNDERYESCSLRAIRFVDRTHKLAPYIDGYQKKSDGLEIRNLKLN